MEKGKDTKKLRAEELEKRVAPAALTYDVGTSEPAGTTPTKATGKDALPK